MILVTGAAGKTGRAVVKALAASGKRVRAFTRTPNHANALFALGAAEVNVGRFTDARALALAAGGAEAIYHICPNVSPHEVAYARAVASAARDHGVKRFVYHSVLHPQIEAMPHHWQKLRVEEMLLGSGFDLTVLQPTAYMQNLLNVWDGIVADGMLRVPYPPETRLSLVDLEDIGEVAATVLMQHGHGGASYELVGTKPLSQTEVASAIGVALGRVVRVEAETPTAWEARAATRGVGEQERAALAAMFRYYAGHGLIGSTNTLRWLLGRPPNDLAAFLGRIVRERESSNRAN
jgi:NAD(P)H dehydrogenase (quinone)